MHPVDDLASGIIWLVFSLPVHPVIGFAAGPLVVLGAIHAVAYLRLRRRPGVQWRATRHALIGSWLALLGWTVAVLQAIALSENSTAALGIVEIPLVGLPLAGIAFPIVWGLSVVVQSLPVVHRREPPAAWASAVAAVIVLLTGAACVAAGYRGVLVRRARAETSADRLRALHDRAAALRFGSVLGELARNEHAPPDLLGWLARHGNDSGIRHGVAGNRATPATILEWLYRDPENRTSLAVNPSAPPAMLRRLATDGDHVVRHDLLFNSGLPLDVLEMLAKDPALSGAAALTLRRRLDGGSWSMMSPPYTWKWSRPFTRVLDDDAPMEQWRRTQDFDSREACEARRSEMVRRPLDFHSHTRCVFAHS